MTPGALLHPHHPTEEVTMSDTPTTPERPAPTMANTARERAAAAPEVMTRLSAEDSARVRRAFARLPYAATSYHHLRGFADDPLAVDYLIAALDALGEDLRHHASKVAEEEDELLALRQQRTAFRAFLGISS